MRHRLTKTGRCALTLSIVFIVLLVAAAVGGHYYANRILADRYEGQLKEAADKLSTSTRTVLVAAGDIKAGEKITSENTAVMEAYSSMSEELLLSPAQLGWTAVIDISAGSHILKAMASADTFTDDLREIEFASVDVPANISVNDIVDIRLMYPDGTDYIVMSKKRFKLSEDGMPVLDVTEEELLLMNSAMVDACIYIGDGKSDMVSRIYAVKYVAPNAQQAGIVDYTPSAQAINLISFDPNIVSAANGYLSYQLRAEREAGLVNYEKTMDLLKQQEGYIGVDEYVDSYYQYLSPGEDGINSESAND